MNCSTIPVELILATTDPKLYDNGWLWNGDLFWAVECLPTRQYSVSDSVLPSIEFENYTKLQDSPTKWDYCNSTKCRLNSESMLVVFTFDPKSTNPKDFLQYVINIHCRVTDYPRHSITDNAGEKLFFDIVEVAKMTRQPYVELWIARSEGNKILTVPKFVTLPTSPFSFMTSTSSSTSIISWGVLFFLIIGLLVAGIFFYKSQVIKQSLVATGNIG